MADEGVNIRLRLEGGKVAASEIDTVSLATARLGTASARAGAEARLLGRGYDSATSAIGRLGRVALITGGIATAVLADGAKRSYEAWEQQRKTAALTAAGIASTGGVAHVTAKDIDSLSASLSRKSGIDRQTIESGENVLLTFRGVRNEVGKGNDIFNRATVAGLDLSVRMQTDLRSALLQVGKALEDPVKGMTSLRRAGVVLSASQQQQVKDLIASNDKFGAQKIILQELTKEFGGSAAAAATPLDKLRAAGKLLEEQVGKGLEPAVDGVAVSLTKMADRAEPAIETLNKKLDGVWNDKKLSFDQKLTLSGQDAQRALKPFEDQIGQAIHGLHLGNDIADAFDYAAPRLAEAGAHAALTFGDAFLHGFEHADFLGKLFALGILEHKLGVFTKAGGLASRLFGSGVGGGGAAGALTARGATPANPLYVAVVNGGGLPGGGGTPTGTPVTPGATRAPLGRARVPGGALGGAALGALSAFADRGESGGDASANNLLRLHGINQKVVNGKLVTIPTATTGAERAAIARASPADLESMLRFLQQHPQGSTLFGQDTAPIILQLHVDGVKVAEAQVKNPRAARILARGVGRAAASDASRKTAIPAKP